MDLRLLERPSENCPAAQGKLCGVPFQTAFAGRFGQPKTLGRSQIIPRKAVQTAYRLAQSGDIVLLSPVCASFDMFKGYAHRAQVFVEVFEALQGV